MSIDARLSVLLVALLAVIAVPAGTLAAAETTGGGSDWPTYGFDAANAGANPDGTGPSESLEAEWTTNTGAPVGGPVVAGDTVFVGDAGGNLTALSRDGTEQWHTALSTESGSSAAVSASPAVADGRVFVAGGGDDSGYLFGVDAVDGTQQWSVTIGADTEAAPAVRDGVVYVGSAPTSGVPGDSAGPLTAVTTGGSVEWTAESIEGEVAASPAVVGGYVYATTVSGTVHKVDVETGKVVANATVSDEAVRTAPAVVDGSVYVGTNESEIYRLDASDLSVEGSQFLNANPILGSVSVVGDTLYAAASGGRLYALDATTLSVDASADPDGQIFHAPSVVGNTVYVTTPFGVHAYDAGLSAIDSARTDGTVRSSVVASDGQAFVGTGFGLTAFGGSTESPAPTPSPTTSTPTATSSPSSTPSPTEGSTPTPSATPTEHPPPTDEDDSDGGGSGGGDGGGSGSDDTSTPTSTPASSPTPQGDDTSTATANGDTVTFEDAPVRTIAFEESVSGDVSVAELDVLPGGVASTPGTLVTAFRIEVPDGAESTDATLRLSVETVDLEDAGVVRADAQVYRWHDGAWQPLETRTAESGDGRVVYEADTPGFSIFAVAGQGATPTGTPTATPTDEAAAPAADSPTGSATPTDRTGPLFLSGGGSIGLLLAVGLGIVLLAVLAFYRLRLDGNVLEPPGE